MFIDRARKRWLVLFFAALLAAAGVACEIVEQPVRPPDDFQTPELTPDDADLYRLEREVEARINAVREEHGEDALEPNATLAAVAREYSCRMGTEGFFAHESPDGDTVDDRILQAGVGFRRVGENLAQLSGAANPGEFVVNGWMESEGHRENLLRPEYTETGVGVCQVDGALYFTQIFLLPP